MSISEGGAGAAVATSSEPSGTPAGHAIGVSGLRKRYEGQCAVDDLDLSVRHGECYALLGPNGAGKTTTIEILQGLRHRDAGEVEVLGVDPARGDRSWLSRIGFVSQTEALVPTLTVRETLEHFANYHSDARATDELLDAVGMREKSDARVGRLSGGQRRRLAVALGVQGRPELLFLDEPTTGMDPVARRNFWTLIEGLRVDGTTIMLTTHYLDEAAHLADRVGVVTAGRLVDVAPPGELGGKFRQETTVRWSEQGGLHEVSTATPSETLRDLLSRHADSEVPALTVTRPTLEDVYLRMVATAATSGEAA